MRKAPPAHILAILLTAASGIAAHAASVPLTFDDRGAKIGEQLPDLAVRTLDNEPNRLGSEIQGRLTLIVTSSFTCPKSRTHYPELALLAEKYKNDLRVVVLYVIEAHPAGDPSPYRNGQEDITPENQRDGILRHQPTTIEKRVTLANEFVRRLGAKIPLLVDNMDNMGWKSVGAGPNMAILITNDRVVAARQGWFDAKNLEPHIEKALADEKARKNQEHGTPEEFKKELEKEYGFLWTSMLLEPENAAKLEKLLKQHPTAITFISPLDRGAFGGQTMLQEAAAGNESGAVKILLAHGADPEYFTPLRPPALVIAAANGRQEIVEALLAKQKHPDLTFKPGPTAMQEALLHGHTEIAQLLKKAGARENFFTLVARGDIADVQAAIAEDTSVVARLDGSGRSPLVYAAATGQVEIAKLLQTAGAPLNAPAGSSDEQPLIWAIQAHRGPMVSWLIGAGIDVNRGDEWGNSPLHAAVNAGDLEAVRILLQAKADTYPTDGNGDTPLHNAAFQENMEIIRALVAAGADVNAREGSSRMPCGPGGGPSEESPLQKAAAHGNLAAVTTLLTLKADPKYTDTSWKTALHHAIQYAQGPEGDAAKKAVVEALVAGGVPVNAEDSAGCTALDCAKQNKLEGIAKWLEAHGGKNGSGESKPHRESPQPNP